MITTVDPYKMAANPTDSPSSILGSGAFTILRGFAESFKDKMQVSTHI